MLDDSEGWRIRMHPARLEVIGYFFSRRCFHGSTEHSMNISWHINIPAFDSIMLVFVFRWVFRLLLLICLFAAPPPMEGWGPALLGPPQPRKDYFRACCRAIWVMASVIGFFVPSNSVSLFNVLLLFRKPVDWSALDFLVGFDLYPSTHFAFVVTFVFVSVVLFL